MLHLPVEYSLVSAAALERELLPRYNLSPSCRVNYSYRGFHDTYLVDDGVSKYILRIYKARWKDAVAVGAELQTLLLLHEKGISVSIPVEDRINQLVQKIAAPEGERLAVLFTFANGESLSALSEKHAYLFGKSLAKLHAAVVDMELPELQKSYSVEGILDFTTRAIEKIFTKGTTSAKKVEHICEIIKAGLPFTLLSELPRGICHGDPHYENVFIDSSSEEVTFFDFDFCGNGFFLYDIGSFCYYERAHVANLSSFLEGYESAWPLTKREKDAIPYFTVLMRLFHLGARSINADGQKNPLWFPEEIARRIEEIEADTESLHR